MGHAWDLPSVPTWRQIARVAKPGAPILAFAGSRTWDLMGAGMGAAGLTYVGKLYWVYAQGWPKGVNVSVAIDELKGHPRDPKDPPVTDEAKVWAGWFTSLKPCFEPVLVFTNGVSAFQMPDTPFVFAGKATKKETSVGGEVENDHPTRKPLAVMQWLVRLASKPGDLVLDPYVGSGTTAAACAEENRRFIAIERDPKFHAIASKRVGLVKEKADAFHGGRAAFDLFMDFEGDE